VIASVTQVEGEGKQKGTREDGMAVPFRGSRGARDVNNSAALLGRENGGGTRLERTWGGGLEVGQKDSRAGMKRGRGERKEKGKQSLLWTGPKEVLG
jgi:hypothetical protein